MQTDSSYILVLALCPGTGNIVFGCAWRQGSKGHARSKVQVQALQGRQRSWDLASRVGTKPLQNRLGFQTSPIACQDGGPTPAPELPPRTMRHEPGCASAQLDAPGQHRPTINALNTPGACRSLISSWAAAACILVSDHSNHCSEASLTLQAGKAAVFHQASQLRSHLICTLGFDKVILHLH